MTRSLIIDASLSGHHETYIANIARGLVLSGDDVAIVTAAEHKDSTAVMRLSEIGASVTMLYAPLNNDSRRFGSLRADIFRERAYWEFNKLAYLVAAISGQVDRVVLPYVDQCIHAMAAVGLPFGNSPVTAITMRPVFHHRSEGVDTPANPNVQWVKRKLFEQFLTKPTLQKVLTIDPTLENFARSRASVFPCWSKVEYMPDPVESPGPGDKYESRAALGLSGEGRIVLLYGALDVRKGVEPLLRALVSHQTADSTCVVLAGVLSPSIRHLLKFAEFNSLISDGRLKVIDRYVTEEEERHLLLASDAVWLGYVGHYAMSSVLVKAAQYGRLVIATQRGLIGWFARQLPGAQVIDVGDPEQVLAALSYVSQASGEVPATMLANNWPCALKKIISI